MIKAEEIILNPDEKEQAIDSDLTIFSYISNHLFFEYFVGYELAALMGYTNTRDVIIKNVSKCNQLVFRDYPGVKDIELDPRTILISRDGAIEMLIKTRKRISPDVLHILKKFHIDTTNRKCLTKEQQTLSGLANAFKTEKIEDQFKVGSYYLDMYFPEYKLVIECDENGHADRKPHDERKRMDFVNDELDIDDCNWIRFNPDEKDFDISKVIAQIYNYIKLKISSETTTTETSSLNLTISTRRCDTCQIVKHATEDFFNKSGSGLKRTCIDCKSQTGKEKAVIKYDFDGTYIKLYPSIKEAAQDNNLCASQIGAVCRGVYKSAGHFIWKYESEVETTSNIDAVTNGVKKPVAQYNKDGTYVKTFESASAAAKEMGVVLGSIASAIKNNFVCKGFAWRYIQNDEVIEQIEEVTEHRKYMKQVEIYKNDELIKSFISIRQAASDMKVNVSMCRKFLTGVKADPSGLVWKFNY